MSLSLLEIKEIKDSVSQNLAKGNFKEVKNILKDVTDHVLKKDILEHMVANSLMPAFVNQNEKMIIFLVKCIGKSGLSKEDISAVFRAANVNGQDVLSLAIDMGKSKLVSYLLTSGVDPNVMYNDDETALIKAAKRGGKEMCESLLNHGADIARENSKGDDALRLAVRGSKKDVAILLASRGADPHKINFNTEGKSFYRSALMIAAEVGDMDKFLKKFLPNISVERFKEVVHASKMLESFFGQDANYVSPRFIFDNIRKAIKADAAESQEIQILKEKVTFLKALDILEGGEVYEIAGGRKIQAIRLPYKGHSAFCIIEYNKEGLAETLSYCDGGLLLSEIDEETKHGYGIVNFKIKKSQESQDRKYPTFKEKLISLFKEMPPVFVGSAYNKQKLKDILSRVVICNEQGDPQSVSAKIMTQRQDRSNCVAKSVNMGMRYLASKINPKLVYSVDENGRSYGLGYEAYKQYKSFVVQGWMSVILDEARKGEFKKNGDDFNHLMEWSLKNSFLQAASKNDIKRLTLLKEILDANNINIYEILNSKGRDALYVAAKNGKNEAFKWCFENGFELKDRNSAQYKNPVDIITYVSRNEQMLKSFLEYNPDYNVDGPKAKVLMEAFAKDADGRNNKIIEEWLNKGFDPNTTGKDGENILISWAMINYNFSLLKIILKNEKFLISLMDEAVTNEANEDILLWAIRGRIGYGQDKTDDEKTEFKVRCLEVVRDALSKGAAESEGGTADHTKLKNAMTCAALQGNLDAMNLLLDDMNKELTAFGEDKLPLAPFNDPNHPTNIALEKGNVEMLQLLLRRGMKPGFGGDTDKAIVFESRVNDLLSPNKNLKDGVSPAPSPEPRGSVAERLLGKQLNAESCA